jgi:hypothetical protein
VHYTASYTDILFGLVACSGNHQTSKKYPGTAGAGGRDKFKCASTTGLPLTNVTPGAPVVFEEWASDYFALEGFGQVLATSISGTASGSGKSFKAIAYY